MALDWLPIDWVTGTIAAVTLAYIYFTWNYNYWKKRGIPYEKPQFFFGNYKDVFFVKKTVGNIMQDLYRKMEGHRYAGIFRFRSPALLVRDPEVIKTVLVKEFSCFQDNALIVNAELDPLLARSPFFLSGDKWKKIRSLLSPSFTSGKMKPLFPLMEKVAEELDQYLQVTAPCSRPDGIEAKELAAKYTTEVVSSCAFGVEGGCFKDPEAEMRAMGRKLLQPDFLKNIQMLLTFFLPALSTLLRIRMMPLEVADFYRRVVKEVMVFRAKNSVSRADYLQLLIQLKQRAQTAVEQAGGPAELEYTDEDVTGHAVTFMTEGFETSSIALSFLLYELAMNPGVQEKLRAELEAATAVKGGKLDYDVIQGLPYFNMVFTESMRMHSPLMTMEKFCTKPCALPTPSGGTYTVEPGTLVLIPVHAIHHDPKFYPEPLRFDPERFSEERKDSIPRYAYLSFGDGPRQCIGMKFAQAQIKVAAARVVLNYDIKPTPRTPQTIVQDPNYFLAAAKGGLWLDFVRRS